MIVLQQCWLSLREHVGILTLTIPILVTIEAAVLNLCRGHFLATVAAAVFNLGGGGDINVFGANKQL